MKTLRNSFLALLGLTFAATVHAGPIVTPQTPPPESGHTPYVTIAGGALWLEDASASGVNLDFDTGFSVLAAVGFRWDYGLAIEVESGYMQVDSAEFSFRGIHGDVDGEFKQVPLMVNAIYHLPLTDRLTVYVGAGSGLVWSDASVDSVAGINVSGFADAEDEWNWAAQTKAGLSFQVCPEATLNIGYRLFYGKDAIAGFDDSWGHVLEGGFTWRF
jgi:opacity protein-like surface antigen